MKHNQNGTNRLSREDAEYIEKLLEENRKTINVTLHNTLGSAYEDLAEDALGQLCLIACEKHQTLKTHESPRAWLIITAKYVSLGMLRKRARELGILSIDYARTKSNDMSIYDEVLYSTWIENDVPQKLLSLLTKRESEVYQKLYIENKTVRETAEELGTTENSIRNTHKNLRDRIINAVKANKF